MGFLPVILMGAYHCNRVTDGPKIASFQPLFHAISLVNTKLSFWSIIFYMKVIGGKKLLSTKTSSWTIFRIRANYTQLTNNLYVNITQLAMSACVFDWQIEKFCPKGFCPIPLIVYSEKIKKRKSEAHSYSHLSVCSVCMYSDFRLQFYFFRRFM
jgi:hypothetical protein